MAAGQRLKGRVDGVVVNESESSTGRQVVSRRGINDSTVWLDELGKGIEERWRDSHSRYGSSLVQEQECALKAADLRVGGVG